MKLLFDKTGSVAHVPSRLHERAASQVKQHEHVGRECDGDTATTRQIPQSSVVEADPAPPVHEDSKSCPPVWAETRQELCETLQYFRSYHGGSYAQGATPINSALVNKARSKADSVFRDTVPLGYLLGAYGSQRDAWASGGRVSLTDDRNLCPSIMVHRGGKSVSEPGDDTIDQSLPPDDTSPSSAKQALPSPASDPIQRFRLADDQSEHDGRVAGLIQSYEQRRPIVLILASDYPLCDFQHPWPFAVLGWYRITLAWPEKESGVDGKEGHVRWKFRFEWIGAQGAPWWLETPARESPEPPAPSKEVPAESHLQDSILAREDTVAAKRAAFSDVTRKVRRNAALISLYTPSLCYDHSTIKCRSCNRDSPTVYRVWLCLNTGCPKFWKRRDGARSLDPVFSQLRFHETFLCTTERDQEQFQIPFDVAPPQPSSSSIQTADDIRGWHCPRCHRLSARQFAQYRFCPTCSNIRVPELELVPLPLVSALTPLIEDAKVHSHAGIETSTRRTEDGLQITTWALPMCLGGGRIHVVQREDGAEVEADDIYMLSQRSITSTGVNDEKSWKDVIRFRRHPLTCHSMKSTLLSQQFTFNYGAEYKHAVKLDTTPMEQAPQSAKSAMALIEARVRAANLCSKQEPFNELYPVRYVESQQMNYHDDGEPGLGPVVASLSLGVTATMSFRLKAKYARGGQNDVTKTIHHPESSTTASHVVWDKPIQEQVKEEVGEVAGDFTEWHTTLDMESVAQNALLNARSEPEIDAEQRLEAMVEAECAMSEVPQISQHNRVLLSVPLKHGSVCIQEGHRLQKFVEHAVEPLSATGSSGAGGLRFAFTARAIYPRKSKKRPRIKLLLKPKPEHEEVESAASRQQQQQRQQPSPGQQQPTALEQKTSLPCKRLGNDYEKKLHRKKKKTTGLHKMPKDLMKISSFVLGSTRRPT
ncbi:hypothetical protein IE81DRAFT_348566 [Ceraceosorus guamensis]|uniref:Alpha-ketoglutarate-dependent dioxygenase AlkB-like domain-containing protein n=1 Tax=Ceraceosorus guamensis TaxID=1522189 RepID=A0A316VUE6_9BASI|nr:hypothetical protein IE81DRAFT_348566 [Ceraceosorus guamensis]PWN41219.1 hypothetical protein IE81DRAFT_348566 [Ceraceosorus guamensis]